LNRFSPLCFFCRENCFPAQCSRSPRQISFSPQRKLFPRSMF
jgi:hypothetical protein